MSSGIEKVECSSAPDEDGKDNATSREKNPESKRRQQVYGRRRFGIFNGSSLDLCSNGLLDHNGFGLLEINSPRILRPD